MLCYIRPRRSAWSWSSISIAFPSLTVLSLDLMSSPSRVVYRYSFACPLSSRAGTRGLGRQECEFEPPIEASDEIHASS